MPIFGQEETRTGVVIHYNPRNGLIAATGQCHPVSPLKRLTSFVAGFYECARCGKEYTCPSIAAHNDWTVLWPVSGKSDESTIVNWAADFMGLERADVEVTVSPSV